MHRTSINKFNKLEVYYFLTHLYYSRKLLFALAKNDFKSRYLGSYLGLIWAFIQPAILIAVMWFVFQVGFKSQPIQDVPFILWLMSGMVPWLFFADSLMNATNSILDNTYLVKKVVFRVSILPIIKILSAFVIHIFFLGVLFLMFLLYGYSPNIYWLQSLYYLFCLLIFVLGLSWITSSVVIFARDISQIISVILQFGFWCTPIFWTIEMVPERYRWLFKLNPIYYIIEGYRDSFIRHIGFWHHYLLSLQFWIVALITLIAGAAIFRRLRPHFADVI